MCILGVVDKLPLAERGMVFFLWFQNRVWHFGTFHMGFCKCHDDIEHGDMNMAFFMFCFGYARVPTGEAVPRIADRREIYVHYVGLGFLNLDSIPFSPRKETPTLIRLPRKQVGGRVCMYITPTSVAQYARLYLGGRGLGMLCLKPAWFVSSRTKTCLQSSWDR